MAGVISTPSGMPSMAHKVGMRVLKASSTLALSLSAEVLMPDSAPLLMVSKPRFVEFPRMARDSLAPLAFSTAPLDHG